MAVTTGNKYHWYLFLVFPFLTGILAIKNYRATWAKNIIWAFVVFYGFTFSIPEQVGQNGESADINRYVGKVTNMYKLDLSFADVVKLYQENEDIDILQLTIAIMVSRVTNSPQVLTAIYGFIFGFFFSRNIWFVLERMKGKFKPAAILLLVTFILVVPFWSINGFRFNTAIHVFIYGLLIFLFDGKRIGILLAALSILVHFSFLLPVSILLLYVLFGNRTVIYFVFFLASTVSSQIDIGALNTFIENNVPKALADRTAVYRNEDKVEGYRTDTEKEDVVKPNWYMQLYSKALQWPLIAFLVVLFFKRKKLQNFNRKLYNSLSFTLFFWGVANLMSSLPSGGRFYLIAILSALPLVLFYVQNSPYEKFMIKSVRIAAPALLLFIVVSIRIGFLSISLNTILSNPFVALITDYNIALDELIKW